MNGSGLALAAALVLLAGLLVAVEAAISTFSRARAEELADEGIGEPAAWSRSSRTRRPI